MKKILYFILALALLTGCDEPAPVVEPETLADKVEGEWYYNDTEQNIEIYLGLAEDGTLELYQKITQGSFRLYRGTWKAETRKIDGVDVDVLSGKYNDGSDWGAEYIIGFFPEEEIMVLSAMTAYSQNFNYKRTEIPAEVKENCVVMVKSPYSY